MHGSADGNLVLNRVTFGYPTYLIMLELGIMSRAILDEMGGGNVY